MNVRRPKRQRGTASLLVALVLLLSTTLTILSVARTRLSETRMAGNEQRHLRLQLLAETAWEKAARQLVDRPELLQWKPGDDAGSLISSTTATDDNTHLNTRVEYTRRDRDTPYVGLEVSVGQRGDHGIAGRVSQTVRQLTVLSPLAETAPPLVLGGCLSTTGAIDTRPEGSDSDAAGDAVWRFNATCPLPAGIDLHDGHVVDRPAPEEMWHAFFSVEREEYQQLAAADGALPLRQRRYWLAEAADDVWRLSLGTPARPVVLVFPAAVGCPGFGAGVRIVGLVFIESACNLPLTQGGLDVTGSLIVTGALDAGHGHVQLNHVQTADPGLRRLALPVLRIVAVPGSWRDF